MDDCVASGDVPGVANQLIALEQMKKKTNKQIVFDLSINSNELITKKIFI